MKNVNRAAFLGFRTIARVISSVAFLACLSFALVSCGAKKVGADALAFKLKNGIPVYYKSVDSTKIASVIICVRGGSMTYGREFSGDRKSTRLNSSHIATSRMPSSA